MSDAKTNTMSWFLQGDDGTVYGPVDTATLQAWCLQGRIEPDNALSRDRQNWVEAADVPELAMDWLARLDDGTRCGPFNLQLVPGLIENGIIPPDAILENRHTGERRTASGRAIADDLFPDWAPTQDDPAEPEPVREDARPPTEHRTPVSVMEGERPREPLSSFASRLDEDDRDGAFLAEGWPADEPVHHEEAVPPGDLLAGTPLNGEEDLPLSRRLEPLQRSASEARQQLGETRHSLQTLRTAHTVLQDETQRLKDDLAAALKARQKSEQQLLEQQDRAAAAETEVENLKAQLGQMKDHYDRLQLENQNQFEKIDSLQATQLLNEQRFKRELTALRDRADAKTELLAGTVQLLMRDSDLAGHLKSVPLAVSADGELEPLKATIKQLEQQLEHERRQARHQPKEPEAGSHRRPLSALPLFLVGALLGAAVISLVLKGCERSAVKVAPTPTATTTEGAAVAPASTDESEFSLETAGTLDLQPEASPLAAAPAEPPREGTALAIQWPALSLPSASIRQQGQTLRIAFNEGIFSVATRLTPEAEAALRSLADQLQGKLQGYQLMIEGHTDATPIASADSRYVDNFALGMARAEAVKTFLAQTGKVPAGAMRASSAGESAPPFPNETEADRKRNRTAVLTLVAH